MNTGILIAVAWADLILCEIGRVMVQIVIPAALIGALVGAIYVRQRRRRRYR